MKFLEFIKSSFFTQTLLSLFALFISCVSVYFTREQLEISREHNRISITPIIHITPFLENKGRNGVYISNKGIGPALLKLFSVESRGIVAQGFDNDRFTDILKAYGVRPECFKIGWPRTGTAIKVDEEIGLFSMNDYSAPGEPPCILDVLKLIGGDGIKITVTYESLYGESKTVTSSSKVKSRAVDDAFRLAFGHR
jgi:hypothetical protein